MLLDTSAIPLISGTAAPFADDTAASIIRREGFPPTQTQHPHIPHNYECACCSRISPQRQRGRPAAWLVEPAELAHEAYRKRMQWDVIEERARPSAGSWDRRSSSANGRNIASSAAAANINPPCRNTLRRFYATLQRPLAYTTKELANPPPPRLLTELRYGATSNDGVCGVGLGDAGHSGSAAIWTDQVIAQRGFGAPSTSDSAAEPHQTNSESPDAPYLLLTVHQGRGFHVARSSDGFQVQARYGNVEGLTKVGHVVSYDEADAYSYRDSPSSPVPLTSGMGLVQWDESFALPLQDLDTPVEIFVVDVGISKSATSESRLTGNDGVLGGFMIAPPVREGSDSDSWSRFRGDQEDLVVTPFSSSTALSPTKEDASLMQEPLISVTVSWEVCYFRRSSSPRRPLQHNTHQAGRSSSFSGAQFVSLRHRSIVAAESIRVTFEILRVDVFQQSHPSFDTDQQHHAAVHCMAQGPDGNCSEFVSLYPDLVGLPNSALRYDQIQDTGRLCAVECHSIDAVEVGQNTVHLLVCCRDGNDTTSVEAGESLQVVAATVLTFSALPSKGTATYVLERPDGDDALTDDSKPSRPFGEVTVNWTVSVTSSCATEEATSANNAQKRGTSMNDNGVGQPQVGSEGGRSTSETVTLPQKPLFEDLSGITAGSVTTYDSCPPDHDLLSLTIVRGIDLRRPSTNRGWMAEPLRFPRVIIAVEQLTASTMIGVTRQLDLTPFASTAPGAAACNAIWNQELVFHLPPHMGFTGRRVELLVAEGDVCEGSPADIASVGVLSMSDRVAPLVTGPEGSLDSATRSVDGFDVVPLTQSGFRGTLGHVLVRWHFARHDVQAARSARWRTQGTSTEVQLKDTAAGGDGDAFVARGRRRVLGDATALVPDSSEDPSLAATKTTDASSNRASPFPSPLKSHASHVPFGKLNSMMVAPTRQIAEKSVALDHSPYGKLNSFAVTSTIPLQQTAAVSLIELEDTKELLETQVMPSAPDDSTSDEALQNHATDGAGLNSSGGPPGGGSRVETEAVHEEEDSDDDIYFEEERDDVTDEHYAGRHEAIGGDAEDHLRHLSDDAPCAPWETNTPVDPETDTDVAVDSQSVAVRVPGRQDAFQETAPEGLSPSVAGVANQLPSIPQKLVFRVRRNEEGKQLVAFFDPESEIAAVSDDQQVLTKTQDGRLLLPPVNGPAVVAGDYERQWSTQLFPPPTGLPADGTGMSLLVPVSASESVARRIMEEELDVQFRAGRRSPSSLRRPIQPQPWYPPGESRDETHVPISRRESERKQRDAIVELRLKSRHVKAESNAALARLSERRVSRDASRSTSVQPPEKQSNTHL